MSHRYIRLLFNFRESRMFHKHGIYSFQVGVQRMVVVGGHNFVADITALRRHGLSGAAEILDLPIIDEQYGETAREAEGHAVRAMGEWIDRHLSILEKSPAVSDVSDSR
jgi:hypothetical protein